MQADYISFSALTDAWIRRNHHDEGVGSEDVNERSKGWVADFHTLKLSLELSAEYRSACDETTYIHDLYTYTCTLLQLR